MEKEIRTRSFHCILNDPVKYGFDGDPIAIMNNINNTWDSLEKGRVSAVSYTKVLNGKYEYRIVLQSEKLMRISALKKRFTMLFDSVERASRNNYIDFLLEGNVLFVSKFCIPLAGSYDDSMRLMHYENVYV